MVNEGVASIRDKALREYARHRLVLLVEMAHDNRLEPPGSMEFIGHVENIMREMGCVPVLEAAQTLAAELEYLPTSAQRAAQALDGREGRPS